MALSAMGRVAGARTLPRRPLRQSARIHATRLLAPEGGVAIPSQQRGAWQPEWQCCPRLGCRPFAAFAALEDGAL
eukprot:CAMPEP_0204161822 /NCGR_PEP_ID=MMETSP0361-20130328/35043_1 /ASSEMBLY_ACC=CAM_ASM_000343 /TAXON_ID=268821 /ORGANISM="Scrippsiella Hangoei, Strain SHTV-5" /LENGTH=74 /DNA_ID=CAMNT_0051118317 /DNA_START=23 /DNA_END=244 /DNA_ORIENTATION=-